MLRNVTLRLSPLLSLLLLLGQNTRAVAGPGDDTPDWGGLDDDDPEDEGEEPEPEPDPKPEPDPEDEAAEDEAENDDYDPLNGLDLGGDDEAAAAEAPDEAPEEEAADDRASRRSSRAAAEDNDESKEDKLDELDNERQRRAVIKVIQKKNFLKYQRAEVTPMVGYIGNDRYVRRFSLGAHIGFHVNEILAIGSYIGYLPDLKETDYKPLTNELRQRSEVVPDISKVTFTVLGDLALSPIYGKVELGTTSIINYDIYFFGGAGAVYTTDDMDIVDSPCKDDYLNAAQRNAATDGCQYVDQWHLASTFGGGLRVAFADWIGVRLEARQIMHIEQVYRHTESEIGLEMKQNFQIGLGVSFFLPPQSRKLD